MVVGAFCGAADRRPTLDRAIIIFTIIIVAMLIYRLTLILHSFYFYPELEREDGLFLQWIDKRVLDVD